MCSVYVCNVCSVYYCVVCSHCSVYVCSVKRGEEREAGKEGRKEDGGVQEKQEPNT